MTEILIKLARIFFYKKQFILFSWFLLLFLSVIILIFTKSSNLEAEFRGLENTEAFKVKKILRNDFGYKLGNSAAIAIEGNYDLSELKNDIKKIFPQISRIIQINSFKKHKNNIIYIEFDPKLPEGIVQNLTPEIRVFLKNWSEKNNIKTYYTGTSALQYDANTAVKNDSVKGELFALFISLNILIFTFGSLLTAFLPLLTGATTIIFLNAIIKFFSIAINPVSVIITGLVGISLAIDYSLFIVSRFKEELDNFSDQLEQRDALLKVMVNTMVYSGKTILYSGLIMLCCISVLFMPDLSITRIVVVNLLIVIFISLINSLFFLPVFLVYCYKYLDKPLFLSNLIKKIDKQILWRNITTHIINYPKSYFLLSLALLLSLSIPALQIKLFSPVVAIAPREAESLKGYNLLQQDGWGGELIPLYLIIKSNSEDKVYSEKFISFIDDLSRELQKHPKVEGIQSLTSWNSNYSKKDYIAFYNTVNSFSMLSFSTGKVPVENPLVNSKSGSNLTLVNVYPVSLTNLNDSYEIISFIKDFNQKNQQFKILVGGIIPRVRDFTGELYNYLPQMFFIIFTGIYLLIFFYMKSVILPIKAGIMNFLPIISAFGLLTLVFQFGYFQKILNTPFNGAVTNIVPIVLFCIVFGLGMDYEVLILSRINEAYQENKDVKSAIIEGMSKSGSLITGAALILVGVFIPGIFSSSPQVQEICLGISSAIVIDATIVRILLVPSFMMLMGKWNWWNPFKFKYKK